MQLESMYQEIILDHYRRPVNAGLREPYEVEVFHVNPTCGDEVRLRVRLDGDRIADVSYATEGCSISQASTSVMSELVIGRTVGEALKLADSFSELAERLVVTGIPWSTPAPAFAIPWATDSWFTSMR